MCDNTDHRGKQEDIRAVMLSDDFDYQCGEAYWCKKCRERDNEMIKKCKCGNNPSEKDKDNYFKHTKARLKKCCDGYACQYNCGNCFCECHN